MTISASTCARKTTKIRNTWSGNNPPSSDPRPFVLSPRKILLSRDQRERSSSNPLSPRKQPFPHPARPRHNESRPTHCPASTATLYFRAELIACAQDHRSPFGS